MFLREKIFRQSSEESESNGELDFDGNNEPDKEYFEAPGSPTSDNADNNENWYSMAIFIIVRVVVGT